MENITRRQALILSTGAAVSLALPAETFAQEEIDEQTRKFIYAAKKIGVPDVAGLRISNRFQRNSRDYLAYSSLILTEDDDGTIVPWNMMDKVHELNLDAKFKDGSVGVLVPELALPSTVSSDTEFQSRLDGFQIPSDFVDYLNQLRQVIDPGLPTTPVQYIQSNGERVLATLRLQSMAIQQWVQSGEIQPQLIGNAATQLEQLLPRSALLTQATDDPDINPPQPLTLNNSGQNIDGLISTLANSVGISNGYARSIVSCESRFDPGALNSKSGARGLWQLMPVHAPRFTAHGWNYWTDWMDPYKNTVIAIEVMKSQGLSAWQCS